MYKINHIKNSENNQDFIEIENSLINSYAKIYLNQGASLQDLKLSNHVLIKDMHPMTYDKTYASSILFPFANRVKDGTYQFNGETYHLDINQKEEHNALHGLVYNKTFEVIKQNITETFASITLKYDEKNISTGFPFTYSIELEYVLTQNTIDLIVKIKNTDSKIFPFTLGWHPYFLSENLYNSSLIFDCNRKTVLDKRNITTGINNIEKIDSFQIKDQSFDDCYVLNYNEVTFLTPKYILKLTSTEEDNFLQIYTPPHKNTIAIEPTTGVSDSLNNNIGLKTLHPDETYSITWNLSTSSN